VQDITDRKRAGTELLKCKPAYERSGETIFLTDVNGTIVYVKPACERPVALLSEMLWAKLRISSSPEHWTFRWVLEFNPNQKAIIVSGFSETEQVLKAQDLRVGFSPRSP